MERPPPQQLLLRDLDLPHTKGMSILDILVLSYTETCIEGLHVDDVLCIRMKQCLQSLRRLSQACIADPCQDLFPEHCICPHCRRLGIVGVWYPICVLPMQQVLCGSEEVAVHQGLKLCLESCP